MVPQPRISHSNSREFALDFLFLQISTFVNSEFKFPPNSTFPPNSEINSNYASASSGNRKRSSIFCEASRWRDRYVRSCSEPPWKVGAEGTEQGIIPRAFDHIFRALPKLESSISLDGLPGWLRSLRLQRPTTEVRYLFARNLHARMDFESRAGTIDQVRLTLAGV